jgi:hypothetical protein
VLFWLYVRFSMFHLRSSYSEKGNRCAKKANGEVDVLFATWLAAISLENIRILSMIPSPNTEGISVTSLVEYAVNNIAQTER